MNELGIALFWCAVQVTLLGFVAGVCYLVGRKLSPSTGTLITLTSLMMVIALSVLTFSPWPQWVPSLERTSPPVATAERTESTNPLHSDQSSISLNNHENPTTDIDNQLAQFDAEAEPAFGSLLWTSVTEGLQAKPATSETSQSWRWPALLGGIIVFGIGIGLIRLYLGWRAVRGYRHQSRPVTESELLELVDTLCAELSYTRPVEVRQSSELVTAATVGWKRPLILLPADWTHWTEQERRVVLAHEIAHISRNDFLAWICAQVGVMLHFYHPLVHWLANRLRLEQELAADAAAAALSGGRQIYLKTLAEMALRQADHRMGWPAQTFLPTRRTFLRRIEMLRDSKNLAAITLSRSVRAGTIGMLLLAGLAVAGLRNPTVKLIEAAENNDVIAQALDTKAEKKAFDLSWVPADSVMVHAVRPSKLLAHPEFQKIVGGLDEILEVKKPLGFSISDLDQAMMLLIVPRGASLNPAFILKTRKPTDFSKLIEKALRGNGEQATYQGQRYFTVSPENPSGRDRSCFSPDNRTIILAESRAVMHSIIDAGKTGASNADWFKIWRKVQNDQAAGIVNLAPLRGTINQTLQRVPQGNPFIAMMPIYEQSNAIAYGASLKKELKLRLIADCKDEEGARKVKETYEAAITLAKNLIPGLQRQIERQNSSVENKTISNKVLELGTIILDNARIEQNDSIVQLGTNATGEASASLVAMLLPALEEAREAARRTQAKNNLKQIAIAMHNYHDTHAHLPAAQVMGPDGKTPHSWRVAILPYIGEEELFKQYNFAERWDSDQNKKILAKIPPVFRNPNQETSSTNTAYFALINKVTIFGNKEGTKFRNVTDGLSNTILVVEAKREIPWTKPEDILYDPDPSKELPKLGGYHTGGYHTALADGAVRFLSEKIDTTVLRALFTIAGGEVIGNLIK